MSIDDMPKPRWKPKRLAVIGGLILLIVLIIFVGFNTFYVVQNN